MVTQEVFDALRKLREAERCVSDQRSLAVSQRAELDRVLARLRQCEFDASRSRQDYDLALQRQNVIQSQYERVTRVLASGGQQMRLGGSLRDLKREANRLEALLRARPG